MTPSTPLSNGPKLRDIHLPPAPAWWPPAPGWWMLVALVLLALVAAAWLWRRHRRQQMRCRLLLDELEKLTARHTRDGDDAALAAGLHRLLRRVARSHDEAATQQRGERWRQTLARVPVAATALDRLVALDQAIYRPQAKLDVPATLAAARDWLRAAARPGAWNPRTETNHV